MSEFRSVTRRMAGIAIAAAVAFVMPMWAQQNAIRTVSVSAGSNPGKGQNSSRVIVHFRSGSSFLPGSGASHALGNGVHVVNNPPGVSVADAIQRYKQNPSVLFAEPDYTVNTTATPTDPMWSQQWDMAKISAPTAWNTVTNTSDVIVAVIDTGVDYTHPDLQGNLWTNSANGSHGYTCMNGACSTGGQDDFGHGTHVAGTIGAVANNSAGIAGLNWRTQILSCKFLDSTGSGSVSDAVLCFNQIATLKQQGYNIRVTNNSWGGGGFSQALKDSMSAVESAGIINICAAGNDGANVDVSPSYPGSYDNRGIISVLASDSSDFGASFSNYGMANVDIAAPGVSTLSTVPTGTCSLCDPSGYKLLSGTSMATPHVTGVVAALFHFNPALTASQARDVLLDPGSYDVLTEARAVTTSTGGRLNFAKALANPRLMSPVTNNFPTITGVSNVTATAGSQVNLSATIADPDGDTLRSAWTGSVPDRTSFWLMGEMMSSLFPAPTGNTVSFQAPALARTAFIPYNLSVADGRGGGASASAAVTVQLSSSPGLPPTGILSVSPTSGPVGTIVSVNYPASDPEGTPVLWDLWTMGLGGGGGRCCLSGTSATMTLNSAGAYRITTQAVDHELNLSARQTQVVRIGGATGTPPIANAVFDKLSGPAPLSVSVDLTSSSDPDGTIQYYYTICQYGTNGIAYTGSRTTCTYDTPGNYWMLLEVKDNDGLMDAYSAYVVVTPSGTTVTPPPPSPGTVVVRKTTIGGTGTFNFTTTGTNLSGFSLTTSSPGTPSSTTFNNVAAGSTSGSRTITESALSGGWQFTSLKCNTLLGSTVAVSGTTATISTLLSGDTVTCDYVNTLPASTGSIVVRKTTVGGTGTFNFSTTGANLSNFSLTTTTAGTSVTKTFSGVTAGTSAGTRTITESALSGGWQFTSLKCSSTLGSSISISGATATIATLAAGDTVTCDYVNTLPSPATAPPSVSITNPTGGMVTRGSTVTIAASAVQGTNPIARVDVAVNGTVKCSDTAAPYTCAWNVPNASGKSYSIQAIVYDTAGKYATSSIVTVTAK